MASGHRKQLVRQDVRAHTRPRPGSPGQLVALSVTAALLLAVPYLQAHSSRSADTPAAPATSSKVLKGLPITELTETEAILHALNRLGYGPRPGDIEHVREIGLAKWIDGQLNPDSLPDSATQARLQNFPTLKMSNAKLIQDFPRPQVAAKREGITVEEYRKQQQAQQRAAQQAMTAGGNGDQQGGQSNGAAAQNSQDPVMQQLEDMSGDGKPSKMGKQGYNGGDPNRKSDDFYQQIQTPQRIVAELTMAKVDRADLQRAPTLRRDGRFLVQSFQCLRRQRKRSLDPDEL